MIKFVSVFYKWLCTHRESAVRNVRKGHGKQLLPSPNVREQICLFKQTLFILVVFILLIGIGPWASLAVKPIDVASVMILGYTKLT